MQYNAIDAMKLFFAICVVGIHADAVCAQDFPPVVEFIVRLAVPFFFLTSGFLMARKARNMPDGGISYYRKSFGKNLRLYLLYLVIYLPLAGASFLQSTDTWTFFAARYAHGILIYGEPPLGWPLWYLYALVLGTGTVMLATRWRIRPIALWVAGTGIYLLLYHIQHNGVGNFCDQALAEAFCKHFVPMRYLNGLMMLTTGIMLEKVVRTRNTMFAGICLLALSAGIYGLSLEYGIKTPLWALGGGAGCFLAALDISSAARTNARLFLKIRTLSILCFFFHMYFIVLLKHAAYHWTYAPDLYGTWAMNATGTLVFALAFDRARRHRRLQWLNKCLQ